MQFHLAMIPGSHDQPVDTSPFSTTSLNLLVDLLSRYVTVGHFGSKAHLMIV
jgi:hypothetical protein